MLQLLLVVVSKSIEELSYNIIYTLLLGNYYIYILNCTSKDIL